MTQVYRTGTTHRRKPLNKRVRFFVLKRDQFTCCYCGRSAPEVMLEIDHKIPLAHGGSNTVDNLVTACRTCNQGKSDILLEDFAPPSAAQIERLMTEPKPRISSKGRVIRKLYLPPTRNGQWWLTTSLLSYEKPCCGTCPRCGKDLFDKPGVKLYLPALDHGGLQREEHPGWDTKGWLWWGQCDQCGHTFFEPVDRDQVSAWGKALGPWSLYGART